MRGRSCAIVLIILGSATSFVQAQEASIVDGAFRTLMERMLESGGSDAAQELEKVGGAAAVKSLLIESEKEGGDTLVRQIAAYGTEYGPAALEATRPAPAIMVNALRQLPEASIGPAIRAAAREPQVTADLVKIYSKDALEVELRQPGVGSVLMQQLGPDGVRFGKRLSTDEAIVVTRHAGEIAHLPLLQRAKLVDAILAAPAVTVAYLEMHPKVLLTAGGVAALIAAKNNLLGGPAEPGKPGFIERVIDGILDRFPKPLIVTVSMIGASVIAWLAIHLWGTWRIKQLRIARERKD